MIDPEKLYLEVIRLMDESGIEYKLFSHKAAFTYEELAQVQKETGFFGTEMKCLVIKADEDFLVYVTLQGKRINFDNIKEFL